MTDDPSSHSPSGPAVPPTVSRTQDAPTGAADVTPASVTSPVSTGPPERPPVHPQHPSSGTWRAVRTAGAPLSVREVEAAASGAPAAHTSAQAATRSSVRSPSETAAASVVLRDLADEYAQLLCAHDPEAAACTGLPDASADLVVGEAMLTIQSPQAKAAIVKEAARLLAPGGRYAIHEMAVSSGYSQEDFEAARKELSRTIKVGARPLTEDGWRQLMEDAGLEVVFSAKAPLRLLEPTRLIRDEGLLGALRFWNNARKMPGAKERLRTMRKAFKVQGRLMGGYVLVAKKPQAK